MSLKRGILIVLMSVWTVCEAQVNLSNGLVAHWTFDGNLQDSAGNHHGTNNGVTLTADRCGRPDRAYAFNGQGQYISVNDAATLRPANITFSVWIRKGTTGQVLSKHLWANSQREMYAIVAAGGRMVSHIKRNSIGLPTNQGWYNVGVNFSSNSWDHFVGTWDGQILRSYLNGQPVNTNTNVPPGGIDNIPGGPIEFGRWRNGNPSYLLGALDEFRIYNRALTAQDVLALYNLEKCPSISNSAIPNGSCCTLRTAFKNGKIILQTSGVINRRGQFVSPGNSLKIVKGAPTRFSLRSYRSSPGRVRRGNTPLKRIPGLGPQGPLSRLP